MDSRRKTVNASVQLPAKTSVIFFPSCADLLDFVKFIEPLNSQCTVIGRNGVHPSLIQGFLEDTLLSGLLGFDLLQYMDVNLSLTENQRSRILELDKGSRNVINQPKQTIIKLILE